MDSIFRTDAAATNKRGSRKVTRQGQLENKKVLERELKASQIQDKSSQTCGWTHF